MPRLSPKWIIGIDVGGTKIALSLGLPNGTMRGKITFSSRKGLEPQKSLHEIKAAISELERRYIKKGETLFGIGIGIPGAVHPAGQRVDRSPNLPKWKGLPLKSVLQKSFRVPVFLENDADVAALGEQHFGKGRGISDFLYVTVSTGIGAGLIINHSLIRGVSGMAGEIGHMTVIPNGFPCLCGKKGCLEAYASGTGIANITRQLLKNGAYSQYFKTVAPSQITGQMVSQAALRGDPVAIKARERAADCLGIGLANVMNLLNPKRIILGGGVMETVHHFWQPMMKAVRREAWPLAFRDCDIVRSNLSGRSGDLGAIALVLERLKKR